MYGTIRLNICTVYSIRTSRSCHVNFFFQSVFEHKYFGSGSNPTEEEIEEMIDVRTNLR
jgi:hypothetical protein